MNSIDLDETRRYIVDQCPICREIKRCGIFHVERSCPITAKNFYAACFACELCFDEWQLREDVIYKAGQSTKEELFYLRKIISEFLEKTIHVKK